MGNLNSALYGTDGLNNEIANMQLMIDGDGSADAHYAEIRIQYGFPTDTIAHEAFNELLSVQSKLDTDSSVSNVKAAILQAFNKLR